MENKSKVSITTRLLNIIKNIAATKKIMRQPDNKEQT